MKRRWAGRLVIGVAALVVGTCTEMAAAADAPPSPEDSAVIQYAELVPSAAGPKAPGIGKKTTSRLSKQARRALDRATDETAESLTNIATSSDYGAPARAPKRIPRSELPADRASLDHALQATVAAAAAPVDDVRMIGLLLAMLAVAVGGGTLSVRKRRL